MAAGGAAFDFFPALGEKKRDPTMMDTTTRSRGRPDTAYGVKRHVALVSVLFREASVDARRITHMRVPSSR